MKKTKLLICLMLIGMLMSVACSSSSTTVSKSPSPNPSPTIERVDTTVNEDQPVDFECIELKRIVGEIVGVQGEIIRIKDIYELWELKVDGEAITSLVGLEHAENLAILEIENNLVDLRGLDSLNHLPYLYHIFITNTTFELPISPLHIENLERLTIQNSNLDSVTFIQNLVSLKHLTLGNNNISEVEPLKSLIDLEYLSLRSNPVTSIASLKDLVNIKRAELVSMPFDDISILSGWKNLIEVDISFTEVVNLKPLEDLPFLSKLGVFKSHEEKHLVFDQAELFVQKGIRVHYNK